MSRMRKIAALGTAGIMALSFAGCADMSKIMTVDGVEVNAGIYIDYMLTEYVNQMYSMYSSGVTSGYLDEEVEDGVKLSDYMKDTAYENCVDLVATNKKFEELGLELSDSDTSEINDSVKSYISSIGGEDFLAEQGISRDSVKQIITASKQQELIFNYYYAKDGVEAVSNDDIKTYLKENYLRYKIITIDRTAEETTTSATTTGEDGTTEATTTTNEKQSKSMSKAADKAAEKIADKYLKLAEENDDFDAVISQYNEEYAATTAATTTAAEEEAADDDASADDSSSATEAETQQTEETKEVSVKFYKNSTEEYGDDTPQKSQTVMSGEKAERPKDPEKDFYIFDNWYTDTNFTEVFDFATPVEDDLNLYANFTTNEVFVDMSDESNSSSDLYSYINDKVKVNVPTKYKDSNNYYIIVKYDPTDRTDYYIDGENYESLLSNMKYEDFDEMMKGWSKDYEIVKNEKGFEKYTPAKVEEILNAQNSDSAV